MNLMLQDSHRALLRTHGIVLARISLGALFFLTGLQILMGGMEGIRNVASMIASVGIPGSLLVALIVVAIKILGGGALMLGYRTGLAAGALIGFTLGTMVFFHLGSSPAGVFGMDPNFFKNLAIVGGLLYAMAYGPGDGWRAMK